MRYDGDIHVIASSLEKQANAIATATYDVLKEGKVKTADLGGTSPEGNHSALYR